MRHKFNMQSTLIVCLLALFGAFLTTSCCTTEPKSIADSEFVHPGILHSQEDLDRIASKVSAGEEPWASGYETFDADPRAQYDYKMNGPYEIVSRRPRFPHEKAPKVEFEDDCMAAYYNALQWNITEDERYAKKAIEILDSYANSLQSISYVDKQLMAGLCGFIYVNAAELMAHTYSKWPASNIEKCKEMIIRVIYPIVRHYSVFANGNWDGGCIKAMLAIGVFCDNQEIFDDGVEYYRNGEGNGRLTHYVINEEGQCQESGRDQQHTMFGLACLAEVCEVAWKQGLDLYSDVDFRLMKGFEYTSKYNLGYDVPFQEWLDTTGKYHHLQISDDGRGRLRALFELPYNHYAKRANRESEIPFLKQAAETVRPEGEPWRADNPGYGTLLFSL